MAVVGLERVADVAEGGSVREDDLPVGADAREQRPVQLGPGEGPAGQGHDPPAPLRDLAELQCFADGGFEAVDPGQGRVGKYGAHREAVAGSLGCASSGVTVTRSQSASGRAASRPPSSASLSARYSPIDVAPSTWSGRLQSRTRCPSSASFAAAAVAGSSNAAAETGRCEIAMNAASASGTSAQKTSWNRAGSIDASTLPSANCAGRTSGPIASDGKRLWRC